MSRPSWDRHFMNMALVAAEMSTCPRAQVGCVLVRDKRFLSSGHNGAPSSLEHCDDAGCLMSDGHCIRALHAEQNAIIQAALHGISTKGAVAYVTHHPCVVCAKMLINAGIWRVVYLNDYANECGDKFFKWAKIQIEQAKVSE